MVSSGRRDPPNGFAFGELSICSVREPQRRRGGERSPEGRRNHWSTLAHPLKSLPLSAAMQSCGQNAEARVQDFPGNPLRPSLRTLRPLPTASGRAYRPTVRPSIEPAVTAAIGDLGGGCRSGFQAVRPSSGGTPPRTPTCTRRADISPAAWSASRSSIARIDDLLNERSPGWTPIALALRARSRGSDARRLLVAR